MDGILGRDYDAALARRRGRNACGLKAGAKRAIGYTGAQTIAGIVANVACRAILPRTDENP